MKRFSCCFLLFALLLSISACAPDPWESTAQKNFALPLSLHVAFSIGKTEGNALLHLTADAMTLGVDEGALSGLVISVSDEGVHAFYDGMESASPPDAAAELNELRRVLTALGTERFAKSAGTLDADNSTITYSFSLAPSTAAVTLDAQSGTLKTLTAEFGTSKITLRVI